MKTWNAPKIENLDVKMTACDTGSKQNNCGDITNPIGGYTGKTGGEGGSETFES